MNYDVTMYSINNAKFEMPMFSNKEKALNYYKDKIEELKSYKIISRIELTQGYKHNNTFKVLESTEFNEEIPVENLSLTYSKKLRELFECIVMGADYFREGEYYYNKETHNYEINRKEEFTADSSLANKEFDNLLAKNNEQIKEEDELYNKIKGSYKCIVKAFNSERCYFGVATIPTRVEKIQSNYINYNYKFESECYFDQKVVRKCTKIKYDDLFNDRVLKGYYTLFPEDLPRTTGTDNDFVMLLLENEYKDFIEECKVIQQEIDEKKRIEAAQEKLEYEERKRKREEWKNTFSVKKQIKLVYPHGGECGTDGYYRVIVQHKDTENEFDVILRNVFDVGCWTMIADKPKEERSEEEKLACKWVYDHSPFTTGIRM